MTIIRSVVLLVGVMLSLSIFLCHSHRLVCLCVNRQLEVLNEERGQKLNRVKVAEKEKDGLRVRFICFLLLLVSMV